MIKLQVLLRKHWQHHEGIAKVQSLMQELGVTTTQSGSASVSAEIDPGAIESVFGTNLSTAKEFPVPESLREFVESITVAPRHILLHSTERNKS